jgi:monoamine oxidase
MAAALAMRRAGWPVRVLEAAPRPGGRCLTLRAGDTLREADGTPPQPVDWDPAPHLYFNAGPARIPHHHRAILGLCRELGVPLEVLVNENRAALLQSDATHGGAPLPIRRVQAELRGVVAEMAAKALGAGALAAPVTPGDLAALRVMLQGFGALDEDLRWRGSSRAGWADPPGMEPGVALPPLDPRLLLDPVFWRSAGFAEGIDYAATMLQPVGGMDAIAQALAAELGEALTLGAEVVRLRREAAGGGVRVTWRRAADGSVEEARAAQVLLALPAPLLAALDSDLSAERRRILARVPMAPAAKLAFQCDRRFWEEEAAIYGGISFTGQEATQIWYPSHGFHAAKGILVGAYIWGGPVGEGFAARDPAARAAVAIAAGEALHPGYGRQVAQPVSVAWGRMPLARGAWAEWEPVAEHTAWRAALRVPEGPYHFAGDHLSALPGWQEGAVVSAWAALAGMARG